jgi:hypothetical protein
MFPASVVVDLSPGHKRSLEMSKILRATVLSLMLVLLLAGCGGGDGADQAEDATQTEAADKATADQPASEHPDSEHPAGEHPAADEPDSAQAKADHPK